MHIYAESKEFPLSIYIDFNISHHGKWTALVTGHVPVGIDVVALDIYMSDEEKCKILDAMKFMVD